jgi:hypothetical protein
MSLTPKKRTTKKKEGNISTFSEKLKKLDTPKLTTIPIPVNTEEGIFCYDTKVLKNKDGTYRIHAFLEPKFSDTIEEKIKIRLPDGKTIEKTADSSTMKRDSTRLNAWCDADRVVIYGAHATTLGKENSIHIEPSDKKVASVKMITGKLGKTVYIECYDAELILTKE